MFYPKILETVKSGKISRSEYRRLVEELDQKRNRNDEDWLKAYVLLNCAMEQRPFPTLRQISNYNSLCQRQSKQGEFRSFIHLLTEELHLRLPNAGQYSDSFASADLDAVFEGSRTLAKKFEDLGLDVFVNSGTLLGLVREGTLLSHDNDLDFAVVLKATSEEDAAKEWADLTSDLILQGIGEKRSDWTTVTLKLTKFCDFGADLFPAWIDNDDRLFIYPHTYGNLNKSHLLPFAQDSLTGMKLPLDSEAVLESNYGEHWRIPNQGWTFKWKEANAQFSKFLNTLKGIES